MRKVIFNKAKEIVCFTMSMGGECRGSCAGCPIKKDDVAFAKWLLDEAEKFKQKKYEVKKDGNFIESGKECFE